MTEYISKDALVAEIEKWISGWTERLNNTDPSNPSFFEGGIEMGKHILSFLNTLEVKEVDLEEKATQLSQKYFPDEENIWARPNYEAVKAECAFKEGAKWQKVKTLSDMKKVVTGKAFQFSMENVEAWGDDSNGNGKTIKLKGRVTFQVNNPESIIDALFAELENDN